MTPRFLIDTSVLSLWTPGRPPLPENVNAVLAAAGEELFLSVVSLMEVQQGIQRLMRVPIRGPARPEALKRAAVIQSWLEANIAEFGDRVLDFDNESARKAGRLSDAAFAKGAHPGFADVVIAATAAVHDLTILTRNLKDFIPLGVPCLDPFETQPR